MTNWLIDCTSFVMYWGSQRRPFLSACYSRLSSHADSGWSRGQRRYKDCTYIHTYIVCFFTSSPHVALGWRRGQRRYKDCTKICWHCLFFHIITPCSFGVEKGSVRIWRLTRYADVVSQEINMRRRKRRKSRDSWRRKWQRKQLRRFVSLYLLYLCSLDTILTLCVSVCWRWGGICVVVLVAMMLAAYVKMQLFLDFLFFILIFFCLCNGGHHQCSVLLTTSRLQQRKRWWMGMKRRAHYERRSPSECPTFRSTAPIAALPSGRNSSTLAAFHLWRMWVSGGTDWVTVLNTQSAAEVTSQSKFQCIQSQASVSFTVTL